jgi:hypothetical protein
LNPTPWEKCPIAVLWSQSMYLSFFLFIQGLLLAGCSCLLVAAAPWHQPGAARPPGQGLVRQGCQGH